MQSIIALLNSWNAGGKASQRTSLSCTLEDITSVTNWMIVLGAQAPFASLSPIAENNPECRDLSSSKKASCQTQLGLQSVIVESEHT